MVDHAVASTASLRAAPVRLLPALLGVGALLLCALLIWANFQRQLPGTLWWQAITQPDTTATDQVMLHFTYLPRLLVAVLAGAALALAGAIFQHLLRNPLAEPATLGISAGAQLALSIATVWFPAALYIGKLWVAMAGAGVALFAVMGLAWRQGLSPVTVTLTGLIVSLYCSTLSAVIALFNHDMLIGLFLWGAGYLDQNDWSSALYLLPRLSVLALLALVLLRPLTILGLDDSSARSLGVPVSWFRFAALALSVALTAMTVAVVGVISFIGLAAPAVARLLGARRLGQQLLWSPVCGALLLLTTDQLVQLLPTTYRAFPTGAMTALLGAPLLLVLLPRLKEAQPLLHSARQAVRRVQRPLLIILSLLLLVPVLLWVALCAGHDASGWHWLASTDELSQGLLQLRYPRAVAAFCGGAMLALAGGILQRMTGNPMAAPEVLGIASGAMLGVIVLMFTAVAPTRAMQIGAGAAGALLVLLGMLLLSRREHFSGSRLLLAGVAISSVSGLIMAVLKSAQDPRLGQLLSWLAGSTYHVVAAEALWSVLVLLVGMALIPLIARWLTLLPLGVQTAASLGLNRRAASLSLLLLTAILTAAATISVGPLSFVGLMGPHFARMAGFQRAGSQLLVATLFGGLVLLVSDWLGRTLIFPFQIPAGLLAAIIGGPFLLHLIARRT